MEDIDLKDIPLNILLEELEKRRKKRIPDIIKKVNASLKELKSLNVLIYDGIDDSCHIKSIELKDGDYYVNWEDK